MLIVSSLTIGALTLVATSVISEYLVSKFLEVFKPDYNKMYIDSLND